MGLNQDEREDIMALEALRLARNAVASTYEGEPIHNLAKAVYLLALANERRNP